jgi:hypothetical protein
MLHAQFIQQLSVLLHPLVQHGKILLSDSDPVQGVAVILLRTKFGFQVLINRRIGQAFRIDIQGCGKQANVAKSAIFFMVCSFYWAV